MSEKSYLEELDQTIQTLRTTQNPSNTDTSEHGGIEMKPVITIDILVTATSGQYLKMSRQEIENPIKNLQTCWTPYKSVFEREGAHYIKRFQIYYKTTRCFDSFRGLRVKYFVTDDFWVGTYLKNRGATEIMKFSTLINLIKGGVTI